MTYLLALIALVTVAVLFWKGFGPDLSARRTPPRMIGPDDDPEFLWKIDRQTRPRGGDESGSRDSQE